MEEAYLNNTMLVCIGNGKIKGDSLGPRIGSFVAENRQIISKNNIEIIGTNNMPIRIL